MLCIEAGIAVFQVKLLLATCHIRMPVQVPASRLLLQLPANKPGKLLMVRLLKCLLCTYGRIEGNSGQLALT